MSNLYDFEYKNMEFSKDGQLDELIVLDRYTVSSFDGYGVGDTVVAIVDKEKETKQVGVIEEIIDDETFKIRDRFGEFHEVNKELLQKPLELKPYQLWERWAKGAASVETIKELQKIWENEFRWLLDGFRYSPGGRIQLMLGQEFVTGKKANLTAYNCYVVKAPEGKDNPIDQFIEVLNIAYKEASIMRRGGGVGLNISYINTVKGSGREKSFFKLYLPKTHKDYDELLDRMKLGKFGFVEVIDEIKPTDKNRAYIRPHDSVEGLFKGAIKMVEHAYDKEIDEVVIRFDDIRHRNAIVKGVNGRSSGAASWMELYVLIAQLLQKEMIDNIEFAEIYSFIVHLIIQGGTRRGALMLVCNVDNQNIHKFITRKRQFGYLSGANVSVAIDDTFMDKVKKAKEFKAQNVISKDLFDAYDLWKLIIESAWSSAEPGVIFMERYNKESNSWYFHKIDATNPCGEQGLPYWGVCNLGHIVLPRFYDKEKNDIKWDELARAVRIAVRFQDNIIDYTPYFLKENEETQKKERRVGMGTMGLGTLLIKLGLRYGSDESIEFIDKLYKFIAYHAYDASIEIAKEKGPFPAFEYDKFIQSGFMKQLLDEFPDLKEKLKKYGIRNVTLLTQAPTGSTGTYIDNIPLFREEFGGTTTGIEPYYSWEYWRASRLGVIKQTVHIVKDYMEKHNLKSLDELPNYFVTAMDLKPIDHVKVQGVVQKWTDSSISKTANCPSDYTVEQTEELYMAAYDLGLKGITIYRDGSRQAQVLATKEEDAKLESHIEAEKLKEIKEKEEKEEIKETETGNNLHISYKVPSRLFGMREKVRYQSGDKISKAYIHIYVDDDGIPIEVWIEPTDASNKDMADALGRMITQFLRFGATHNNVEQAIKHLKKGKTMYSLPAIVGRLLESIYYGKIQMPTFKNKAENKEKQEIKLAECPTCGEKAYDKGNCICHACGVSKCN